MKRPLHAVLRSTVLLSTVFLAACIFGVSRTPEPGGDADPGGVDAAATDAGHEDLAADASGGGDGGIGGCTTCDGVCVDTSKNPVHCGACGAACRNPGPKAALDGCIDSRCVYRCEAGWVDANEDPVSDGCEIECEPTNDGEELCDGIDNDCDGTVDDLWAEDLGVPCTTGVGECRAVGNVVCSDNQRSTRCDATPANPPTAEVCDGKDNDCDGDIDEPGELPEKDCDRQLGACAGASIICSAGLEEAYTTGVCPDAHYKALNPQFAPTEICDDGIDNDCDGFVDCIDFDCTAAANPGGAPAACGHRLFVTSASYNGDLRESAAGTGIAGGDAKCQRRADAAGLGGTWRAVLGAELSHPKDRIPLSPDPNAGIFVPVAMQGLVFPRRITQVGELFVSSPSLDSRPDRDEQGDMVPQDSRAHTGLFNGGAATADHCLSWTLAVQGSSGSYGNVSRTNSAWLALGTQDCDRDARLYCIDER